MIVWGGYSYFLHGGAYYPGFTTPSVAGPSSGCADPGVSLSTQAYSAYQWIQDGSDIPGATSQSYTATASGTYSVRVTDQTGCIGTSAGQELTILPVPTPAVYGESVNTCPATGVTLSTDPAPSYQWRHNGAIVGGATGQSYLATVSGDYTVTTTDGSGCLGTSAGHAVSIGFCPASEVSPPPALYPARLVKDGASSTGYYLFFQKIDGALGYNIYFGTVGDWYSHGGGMGTGRTCDAAVTDLGTGEMRAEVLPPPQDASYYLITAFDGTSEGPSGFDSHGTEIPASLSTCSP
jgi:hypothetical protein